MTDVIKLEEAIKHSGLKLGHIAEKLGLTRQGFKNKLEGKTEFVQTEILVLSELLNLKTKEAKAIFFATKVDK